MKEDFRKYLFLILLFIMILPADLYTPRLMRVMNSTFGSVPVFMIAVLFHPLWAAAAGLLSGLLCFYRYQAVLYIPLFLLEALFLSLAVRKRRRGDLILYIILFWLAGGLPSYIPLQFFVFKQPPLYVAMSAGILLLNSVFSASLVSAVFCLPPVQKIRLIRQYRFNTAFNTLASFTVMMIMFISATVILLEGRYYGQRYREASGRTLESQLNRAAAYTDEWIEKRDRSLQQFAELLKHNEGYDHSLYRYYLDNHSDFKGFTLYKAGEPVYSSTDSPGPDLPDPLPTGMKTFTSAVDNSPLMMVTLPFEEDYSLLAVAGFESLSELLDAVETGEHISYAISDRDGRLLAGSKRSGDGVYQLKGREGRAFIEHIEEQFPLFRQGVSITTYVNSGLWKLTVLDDGRYKTLLTFLQWISRILTLIAALILTVLLVMWFLARRIVGDLDLLILQSSKNMYGLETGEEEEDEWPEGGVWELSHLSYRLKEIMAHQKKAAYLLNSQNRKLEEMNSALARSEDNLRITLNSIADGVLVSDGDGFLTSINPVAVRLTGYEWDGMEKVRVEEVLDLKDENSGEICSGLLEDVLTGGETVDPGCRYLLEKRDGDTSVITIGAAPIRQNMRSSIQGAVIVLRDITESRALEEQLRQSQKMEVVGQLAGGIAHDFNNLLGGIQGIISMMKLDLEEEGKDGDKKFEGIIALIRRASDLTAKLLSFSRKGKMISRKIDLHPVIEETIELLIHTFPDNILIRFEPGARQSSIHGDPTEIQRVLMNLALNARDAMPGGGNLSFTTENRNRGEIIITFGGEVELENDFLLMRVSDTGSGIPESSFERIFEPFYTTKEIGQGSGLGLSAVYGSILEHQGFINVESRMGEGTVFFLYYPLAADSHENSPDD